MYDAVRYVLPACSYIRDTVAHNCRQEVVQAVALYAVAGCETDQRTVRVVDVTLRTFPLDRECFRQDAVQDLIDHPTFEADFSKLAKGLPDLERIVSRIHAKNCKVKEFLKVLEVRLLVVAGSASTRFLMIAVSR
jgi:hypothetical protein